MMIRRMTACTLVVLCAVPIAFAGGGPLGTAFTYQCKVIDGGVAADGTYDFKFRLHDDAVVVSQVGSDLILDDVVVTEGLITIDLDFGSVFDGTALWLEIDLKADADVTYDTLAPRQPLHATPYATFAMNVADTAVPFSFNGADAVYTGGQVGIGTSTPGASLDVVSTDSIGISSVNATAIGVFGSVSAPTGADFGIWGESASTSGTGLYGFASASSGTNYALYAETSSPDGYAGYFKGGRNYFEGNVGIGTTAPERRLHVANGDAGVTSNVNAGLVLEDDSTIWLNLLAPDANEMGILFGKPTGGAASGGITYNSGGTPDGIQFRTGGNVTQMIIQSTGSVGIGTTSPQATLDVQGDFLASGSVGIGLMAPERRLHVAGGESGVASSSQAEVVIEDDSDAWLNLLAPNAYQSGILFGNPAGGNASGRFTFNAPTTPDGFQITTGIFPRMVIDNTGNVGIGTTSPNFGRLEIRQVTDSSASGLAVVDSHALRSLRLWVDASDVSRIDSGGSGTAFLALNAGGGNVGVGTSSPSFKLEVNGSAGKPGGGSWSVSSDRRLKKNIRDLDGSLSKLLALRGVTFEYIENDIINELPGKRIGMIAQEVEAIFPDWVSKGGHGYRTLTFRGFEALTVEAFRELRDEKDRQIDSLRSENEYLRERLDALEAIVREMAASN